MKKLLPFFCFLFVNISISQNLIKKEGNIQITKIGYFINHEKGSKKSKTEKTEYFFDEKGNILEILKYGNHHEKKLSKIGQIQHFKYENNKLIFSEEYTTECFCEKCNKDYTKYFYNEKDELINEKTYNELKDSLIFDVTYINDKTIKETHSNQLTYYQSIFNSDNKIIELNQVFEESKKIRWQKKYEYLDHFIFINFQTFYGDGTDYNSKEIICLNYNNQILSREIFHLTKTTFKYSYSGNYSFHDIIKEIKEYNYEDKLDRITEFKVIKSINLNKNEVRQKINKILIE